MTNQEAFDRMMEHLRSLKGRSMDDLGNACVYTGIKCAVGALMTEEEQDKFGYFEGCVTALLNYMADKGHTSELHALDLDMLMDMQILHDRSCSWSEGGFIAEETAQRIAEKYGLDYTAP